MQDGALALSVQRRTRIACPAKPQGDLGQFSGAKGWHYDIDLHDTLCTAIEVGLITMTSLRIWSGS